LIEERVGAEQAEALDEVEIPIPAEVAAGEIHPDFGCGSATLA